MARIPKPKLRELGEALRSFVSRPYTTAFPAVPSPAPPGYRGAPLYYEEDCIGCRACAEVCPAGAIIVEDRVNDGGKAVRTLTVHYERCIFCGHCEANCSTERGIRLSEEYDFATLDRSTVNDSVEKELCLCEGCGAVIAPFDQLVWIARRVGVLAYSNPTLLFSRLQREGREVLTGGRERGGPLGRGDLYGFYCPRCRRDAQMTEEW